MTEELLMYPIVALRGLLFCLQSSLDSAESAQSGAAWLSAEISTMLPELSLVCPSLRVVTSLLSWSVVDS